MIQLTTPEFLTVFGLGLTIVGIVYMIQKDKSMKIDELKKNIHNSVDAKINIIQSSFEASMHKVASEIEYIVKNYAHKDDLRTHMEYQNKILEKIEKEAVRINERFDRIVEKALAVVEEKNHR